MADFAMWVILGIEPTKDLAEIKRAYAKKVKECRPEEDLLGFQELRDAFEEAKWYASDDYFDFEEFELSFSQEVIDSMADDEIEIGEIEIDETYDEEDDFQYFQDFTEEPLYGKLILIYNDFAKRRDVGFWKELLEDDTLWDFEIRWHINEIIVSFLIKHHYLPTAVWSYLYNYLLWTEDFDEYEEDSDLDGGLKEFAERNKSILYNLSYETIETDLDIDYDQYLKLRDSAFDMVRKTGKIVEAEARIKEAKAIYGKDSELIFLERHNARLMLNQTKNINNMQEFSDEHPEHLLARYTLAKMLRADLRYAKALVILKNIDSGPWTDGSVEAMMGFCLWMTNHDEEAYLCFQKALLRNQNNKMAVKGLASISMWFSLKAQFAHYGNPFSIGKKEKYHAKKREYIEYREIRKKVYRKSLSIIEGIWVTIIIALWIAALLNKGAILKIVPYLILFAVPYIIAKFMKYFPTD